MLGRHDKSSRAVGCTHRERSSLVPGTVGPEAARRPPPAGRSPSVACGFHFFGRQGLRLLERLLDGLLARQRGRELLAHRGGDAGELGDRDELDTRVGNGIDGRIGRVGRVDRVRASSWRTAPGRIPHSRRARCGCPAGRWPSLHSRRRGRCIPSTSPRRRTSSRHRWRPIRPGWPATRPTTSCLACRARYRARERSQPGRRPSSRSD